MMSQSCVGGHSKNDLTVDLMCDSGSVSTNVSHQLEIIRDSEVHSDDSDAGESSIGSVVCARDFESNVDIGEPTNRTSELEEMLEDSETKSEAGESSIVSVCCARDFESDCEICDM